MSILATAPGRCGLIGTPTDMYGGSVISCTTRERAQCRLDPDISIAGITLNNDGESASLLSCADLTLRGDKLDIARAALTFFALDPVRHAFSLSLSTAIPMRAGLSGSTALLAAIVGVLSAYEKQEATPYALAETTRKIEARLMGVVCGFQDQHMAVFGGLNFMDFAGKESLEQREDEPLATIEPLAALIPAPPLLLAHTGVQHHSGSVHRSPRERWMAGEPLVRDPLFASPPSPVRANALCWNGTGDTLGELMNENHRIVANLGGSGPDNDRLIEAARKAGAWGAKLAGAGGGGTILALTDDPKRVGAALMAAGAERLLVPSPQPGLQIETA